MKNLVIILVGCLAVLLIALLAIGQFGDNSANFYKTAPHVTLNDEQFDFEGKNLYYYYQEDCSHCNAIKSSISNFYNDKDSDIDFYLVDAAASDGSNQGVWTDASTAAFEEPSGSVSTLGDVQIQGTPSLVDITDGEVKYFAVGETEIPSYLETLK